jgi:hypothetical protein
LTPLMRRRSVKKDDDEKRKKNAERRLAGKGLGSRYAADPRRDSGVRASVRRPNLRASCNLNGAGGPLPRREGNARQSSSHTCDSELRRARFARSDAEFPHQE